MQIGEITKRQKWQSGKVGKVWKSDGEARRGLKGEKFKLKTRRHNTHMCEGFGFCVFAGFSQEFGFGFGSLCLCLCLSPFDKRGLWAIIDCWAKVIDKQSPKQLGKSKEKEEISISLKTMNPCHL